MKEIPADKQNTPSAAKEAEILSPAKLGWRRFKRDKIGMIGSVMVIFLICSALFGHYFSPTIRCR